MQKILLLAFCGLTLAGCEQLGIEDPGKVTAAREAEGRAIGGACRHSGRALEDCYNLNKKAAKAAIFTGWRDMDAYMRENSIEIVPVADQATTTKPKAEAADPGTPPAAPEAAAPPPQGAIDPRQPTAGKMV